MEKNIKEQIIESSSKDNLLLGYLIFVCIYSAFQSIFHYSFLDEKLAASYYGIFTATSLIFIVLWFLKLRKYTFLTSSVILYSSGYFFSKFSFEMFLSYIYLLQSIPIFNVLLRYKLKNKLFLLFHGAINLGLFALWSHFDNHGLEKSEALWISNQLISYFLGFVVFAYLVYIFRERKLDQYSLNELIYFRQSFLSTLSHEIRTSLNGITGVLETYSDENDLDQQKALLGMMQESADNLLVTVNNLLDLANINMGKLKSEPMLCDLKLFMRQKLNEIRESTLIKRIKFSYILDDDLIELCLFDRRNFSKVIDNYKKYITHFETPEYIHIRVMNDTFNNEVFITEIIEKRPHKVFLMLKDIYHLQDIKKFSTNNFNDIGVMNLIVNQGIINNMGGEIEIEWNEYKKEIKTTIKLPYQKINEKKLIENKNKLKNKISDNMGSEVKKVLIVEDDDVSRIVSQRIFSRMGYDCDVAANGKDAYDCYVQNPKAYDVIFMDIQMPVMNGLEATEKIREFEASRNLHVKIIALTANALMESSTDTRDLGFDGYIIKPFNRKKVEELMTQLSTATT